MRVNNDLPGRMGWRLGSRGGSLEGETGLNKRTDIRYKFNMMRII